MLSSSGAARPTRRLPWRLLLPGELTIERLRRHYKGLQHRNPHVRYAELEINAGERPTSGEVALPEDTGERIAEWAEGEGTREREREALAGELSQAMRAHGRDPTLIREAMGG